MDEDPYGDIRCIDIVFITDGHSNGPLDHRKTPAWIRETAGSRRSYYTPYKSVPTPV